MRSEGGVTNVIRDSPHGGCHGCATLVFNRSNYLVPLRKGVAGQSDAHHPLGRGASGAYVVSSIELLGERSSSRRVRLAFCVARSIALRTSTCPYVSRYSLHDDFLAFADEAREHAFRMPPNSLIELLFGFDPAGEVAA